MDGVAFAERKSNIPVLLSRQEIDRVIDKMKDPYDLVVKLMYGFGLRLSECMKLQVHCFDFDHQVLTVHDVKGKKDRNIPMPKVILDDLKRQMGRSLICMKPISKKL